MRVLFNVNGTIVTLDQLERHLWGAADILRGSIDSGDYKHYIFGLLFYKRLSDVWEEEYEELLRELLAAVGSHLRGKPCAKLVPVQAIDLLATEGVGFGSAPCEGSVGASSRICSRVNNEFCRMGLMR